VNNVGDREQLRQKAIALRRAGQSIRQIKQVLGPIGNVTLSDALRGEPPPEWTLRPNAKDDLRAQARELRLQGLDYDEIVARLGVSKSSVSLWVRGLPRPARVAPEECAKRTADRMRRYWTAERGVRATRRAAASCAARASIGGLTDREILIAGAVAYWCEGAKSKPHRPRDRVVFINSDPDLIRFFLRFLDATGTARTSLSFRIYIHESADVEAAQRFWLGVTEATAVQFLAPMLKQHNPMTVRKNVGEDYHGCLRVDVHRSADLYRKIQGWAAASTAPRRAAGHVPVDQ
jgi:transcriptional regulator with XRE-family HTH domain